MSKSFEYDQPAQVTSDTEYAIMIFSKCFMKDCKLFSFLCWTEAISLTEILNG